MIPVNQEELDQVVNSYKIKTLDGFNLWFERKIRSIASYLYNAQIKDVVVGVSGGIDSAVVLGLLTKVKDIYPITIHAYTIHFDLYDGIFDSTYVDDLKNKFGDKALFKTVDASKSFNLLLEEMGEEVAEQIKAQSSYALRYQMLFTYAQMHKAVTIGTTNRDEFEYSGWFGKNSDMVVDLQIISDWHKFQVVEAARMLGVPESIINRKPVGDLLDRSTDEDNFGCSYDELSYFTGNLAKYWRRVRNPFLFEKFEKLCALHEKNAHKYQGQTFNPVFIR